MLRTRNLACVLGRFNPLHFSHLPLFEEALSIADHVAVVLGSYNQALTSRNPFTCEEREEQILANFDFDTRERLKFFYAEDFPSDLDWARNIGKLISERITVLGKSYLIEFHKDDRTRQGLEFLRQTLNLESRLVKGDLVLSSTQARRSMLLDGVVPPWIPEGTRNWIKNNYLNSERHRILSEEARYLENHFRRWEGTPYPVSYQAADAVCFSKEKVLLIRRNSAYGKGLLAVPGGMLEVKRNETLRECALRELREETRLYGVERHLVNLDNPIVFDNPWRSLRGRVISNAFLFNIPDGFGAATTTEEASEIIAMDVGELEANKRFFFEDHFHIIRRMLGLL